MGDTFRKKGAVWQFGIAMDGGSAASLSIDSAYTFESAGDAIGICFCSPVTQNNGALLFYALPTAVTGTAKFKAQLRNSAAAGGDETKPEAGGAVLATSDERTITANEWEVFTFSGVSLTAGMHYWLIIYNSDADPTNNYGSWMYRGALDAHSLLANDVVSYTKWAQAYTTANGFSTVTAATGNPPAVLKFADNTIMGFPYTSSASHADNANERGNRLAFPVNIIVGGINSYLATSSFSGVGVYDIAGNTIVATTHDERGEDWGARLVETQLTAETSYDYICVFGGSSSAGTIYGMTEAEANVPVDVKAAGIASFVDGTIGSFTPDTSKCFGPMVIIFSDIPVAAGGGGGLPILGGSIVR